MAKRHLLIIDPQNDFCDLPAAYCPVDPHGEQPCPRAAGRQRPRRHAAPGHPDRRQPKRPGCHHRDAGFASPPRYRPHAVLAGCPGRCRRALHPNHRRRPARRTLPTARSVTAPARAILSGRAGSHRPAHSHLVARPLPDRQLGPQHPCRPAPGTQLLGNWRATPPSPKSARAKTC